MVAIYGLFFRATVIGGFPDLVEAAVFATVVCIYIIGHKNAKITCGVLAAVGAIVGWDCATPHGRAMPGAGVPRSAASLLGALVGLALGVEFVAYRRKQPPSGNDHRDDPPPS